MATQRESESQHQKAPTGGAGVAGRALVVTVVVLICALTTSLVTLSVDGPDVAAAASDLLQGAAAVFAGVMCLLVGRRTESDGWAHGWRLIGLGMLAWAAGECVWSYYEVVRRVPGPELSAADIGFLALVPLVLWGTGRLIGLYRGVAMGLIEGLVIAGSVFFVSWATILGPGYELSRDPHGRWLAWVVNIAYPLGDVAIASAALILLGSVLAAHRIPVALLAGGMIALSVSDSFYVATSETYQTGHQVDLGWVVGFLLVGMAGAVARGAMPSPASPALSSRTDRPSAWLALPYVPLFVAALTSIAFAASGAPPSIVLSVLLVALFGLVVLRQLLALRERRALAANLQKTLQQVRQQREILNQLAFTDPLTGLANRAMFEERIMPPGPVQSGSTTAMFVDLDGFKEVNDLYGHDTGDAVLVATASRLRACCRANDTVARVGGDEFVVVTQGVSAGVVEQIAQRFVTAMRQPVNVDGTDVAVSASIGIASGDPTVVDVHELIRRADAAMYIAKLSGKGRHATYPSGTTKAPAPDLTAP